MSTEAMIFFIEWCHEVIPILLLYALFISIIFFISTRLIIKILKIEDPSFYKAFNLFSLSPIFLFILFMLFVIFLPAVLQLL